MSNRLDGNRFFSSDYAEARQRFREATIARGGQLHSYSIDVDSDLTIDVAILGKTQSNRVTVVSSGVHGVEGFFGSAVQLAWMETAMSTDQCVVLIHAVNPFGFAHLRRWNEDNVDLNRNFLIDDQYRGASAGYVALNPLLNPTTPPNRLEPFKLKALWTVLRRGMPAVKQAVAGGQYEFPQGLFFGGTQASASTRIVKEHFQSWIGTTASSVVHLDFHSGLGKSGDCTLLLLNDSSNAPTCQWYRDTFPGTNAEPFKTGDGTAYDASGSMGGWLMHDCRDINYRFACAEFGTQNVIRVLAGLRRENRAHFYGSEYDKRSAQRELLECFCPASKSWRDVVIDTGVDLIRSATITPLRGEM